MKVVRTHAEWAALRARGRRWFLLRYGVLGRGLPLALLCAVGTARAPRVSRAAQFRAALFFRALARR